MRKKNILFIMTDQQRLDALGCVNGWMRTPALDALAKEGVLFTRCITNSPVCIPARFSLATGYYPHQTGIFDNIAVDMLPSMDLWTRQIKEAGYNTGVFGKTHLHRHTGDLRDREHLVNAYGFDVVDEIGGPRASAYVKSHMTDLWDEQGWLEKYCADYKERFDQKPHWVRPSVLPLGLYADNYVGQQANNYLKQLDKGKPWFCWVSFGGPHEPWDAPEPYASMYKPSDMPKANTSDLKKLDKGKDGVMLKKLKNAPELTRKDVQEMRANYAGNVSLIDEQIYDLLETIKQRGEYENTIVVFTSDHGEMNGDHGLIYKNVFFNEAIKVPLIISTPETRKAYQHKSDPEICAAQIELFDLGPTILDMLEIQPNDSKQSARAFSACLLDTSRSHRDWVFSEVSGEVMVMDGQCKLVANSNMKPYMQFDLNEDVKESQNVVNNLKYLRTRYQLTKRIKAHIRQS
ncbi:MAG: sulfatase family protein [Arenicella sp.]